MNDNSTSSEEQGYNGFRDFGGPDPQIKIITSDNHAFMVPVKVLTDASAVFRGMIDTCSGTDSTATLELSDETEDWHSVQGLLECMTSKSDYRDISDHELNIVELAKRYECSEILVKIELALYRKVLSRYQSGDHVFGLAAALEAWPLCGHIISDTGDWNLKGISRSYMRGVVDPTRWSVADIEHNTALYGALYVWGMNRSAMESYHPDTGMDYRRMGRIFSVIMREAKKDKNYRVDQEKLLRIAPLLEKEEGNKRRR